MKYLCKKLSAAVAGLSPFLFGIALVAGAALLANAATQTEIIGPTGSVNFGTNVTVLPNGNFVVTDPYFGLGTPQTANAGAVYLYNGTTNALIGRMTGVTGNDYVGNGGIIILSNGDFVVSSPNWNIDIGVPSGFVQSAGAVTRCSSSTGCPFQVTAANSLTGSISADVIGQGEGGITALNNGNFVVRSPHWHIAGFPNNSDNVGAVTFCGGASCANKKVSATTSLIGSVANDSVGNVPIAVLTGGDYVVSSPDWNKGAVALAGAITLCSGTTGCTGTLSSAASLTGSTNNDTVGVSVQALPNNLYLVSSSSWNKPGPVNTAGAVTLCSGTSGNCTGQTVTVANSLTGRTTGDQIGSAGVTVLSNGDYITLSPYWDRTVPSVVTDVGAVTLCRAATNNCAGQIVTNTNSLTGSLTNDVLATVSVLANNNYVVSSSSWRPTANDNSFGAAAFCNSSTNSCSGQLISGANSLVGSTIGDGVGEKVTALTNGNYVVSSSVWSDPNMLPPQGQAVGAVTLCNGTTGCVGAVSRANSLSGSQSVDYAGSRGVTALANGGYVVHSPNWIATTTQIGRGAVTLCGANNNCAGQTLSAGNSLTGTNPNDRVGLNGSVALTNGNYVVVSSEWDISPSLTNVGAVTFCNATTNSCASKQVSTANSLVGSAADDNVGAANDIDRKHVTTLSNGTYVVISPNWDNGAIANAGAATVGDGNTGVSGTISSANSLRGTIADGGGGISFASSAAKIFIGLPKDNKVTIFGTSTRSTPFDFDGDGKTDLSIFRPGPGEWWWNKSSNGGNAALQFGASTDKLAAADFTGDGKTDVAFWRPLTGQWFVLRSEDFSFYAFPFGATGDVPVPGDYDGDGKADAAVFRESSLTWFISKSSGGTDIVGFGAAGDKPVNADYDGDGKSDIAIFRPSGANGAEWWVRRSSNASVFALQFGTATDKAVPGDFTGDGKADVAFWRPSTGFWNILRSEDSSYYAFPFGASGDVAVPGDYDGDGKIDAAVFRPSSSTWFANRSGGGTLIQQFGIAGDVPLPSAFVR